MKKSAEVDTDDSVQVVNLVDGKSAMIESVDGSFEAFEIHYAETAIIPAGTGKMCIRDRGYSARRCPLFGLP